MPQHFNSVLRSTAASTLSDVLVHAADLTGLMATVRRDSFQKNNGAPQRAWNDKIGLVAYVVGLCAMGDDK